MLAIRPSLPTRCLHPTRVHDFVSSSVRCGRLPTRLTAVPTLAGEQDRRSWSDAVAVESANSLGLEDDPQARTGGVRETLQRVG
jgi:hypothetical protein